MVMNRAGFDVNSLTREYARKIMKSELPIPADDSAMRIMPIDAETVVTVLDFQRMTLAASESFRNSKEAN